jgi:hypothetical protein
VSDETKHPGYHDIRIGMRFEEVGGQRRAVQVSDTGIYHAFVKWTSPRGIPRAMQVPNKRLSDPTLWRYLGSVSP